MSKFIELAKQYEKMKEEMDVIREELTKEMLALGFDKFVQDPETMIVYKTAKPTGTFVYYKDIDYVRTKKEGERAGTLSAKAAEENGFILTKQS